jgi:hypothetical protein
MNEKCINKIGFIFKNAQINLLNKCVDKPKKKLSCYNTNEYKFLNTEPINYINKKKSKNNNNSNTISSWSSFNIDKLSNISDIDNSLNELSELSMCNQQVNNNYHKHHKHDHHKYESEPEHHKHEHRKHDHHKHDHHKYDLLKYELESEHHKHVHHHKNNHHEKKKYCTSLFSNNPKTCYISLCKQDLVSSTLALAVDFNECWNGFVSNLYTLLKGSFLISFNKCDSIITIYAELFKYKLCADKDEVYLFFKYNIVPPTVQCSEDLYKMDLFYKLHNEKITNVRFYYDDTKPFNPIRHIVYPQL